MITANTKCVVNGDKINNEIIPALNALLNMEIIIGDVAAPEIRFTSESAQIVIPPSAGAETNEELDIVDSNNQAAKRWFLTTLEAGVGGEDTTAPKIGTSAGGDGGSTENTEREKLGGGALLDKNRDKLNTGVPSGALLDTGGSNQNGGVLIDNPQNKPKAPTGGATPNGYIPLGDDTRGEAMSDTEYKAWLAAGSPPPRSDKSMLPRDYADGGGMPLDTGDRPGAPPRGGEPRQTSKTKKDYDYGPRQQPPSVRQIIENQRQKYNDLMAKAERDASSLTMAERRFLYERQMAVKQHYQQQAEKDAEANERYINDQLNNQ